MSMNSGNDTSLLDLFLQELGKILSPAGEALRLQGELDVNSLEETDAAAERAGYEVCYVDLPDKVSGFADTIEGKLHIVLNRAKSRQNLEYTLPHELGHCVLHLNPSHRTGQSGLAGIGIAEFQANLFATTWVSSLGNDRQREHMLTDNRESRAAVAACIILTLALAVIALLAWLYSKLFDTERLVPSEA